LFVCSSVGHLLETGTGPQGLSGWFLGHITMVLKNQKPSSGTESQFSKELKKSNSWPAASSFMKPTGSFKVFEVTRIHNFFIPIFLFFERTDPEMFLKLAVL
jgi:hypothetical protein